MKGLREQIKEEQERIDDLNEKLKVRETDLNQQKLKMLVKFDKI